MGLKAYSSLISRTITDSRTLWEEQNPKAVEALKKQREQILSSAKGYNQFNMRINDSVIGLSKLQAAVGSKVFPMFTKELNYWNMELAHFTPQIAQTAGDQLQGGRSEFRGVV